jgi:hypothetical protein
VHSRQRVQLRAHLIPVDQAIHICDEYYKTGEFALNNSGRHHPDTNVFRRLQRRLCGRGRLTSPSPINAGHLSAVRTPGHENAIIAAVKGETWRITSYITPEFGVSRSKFLSLRLDHQLDAYHFSRDASIFPHDLPLTIYD